MSPIAQALIGTSVGDEMALPSQRAAVTKLEPGT
jgi:transcription elongation GreA/GreB family factor